MYLKLVSPVNLNKKIINKTVLVFNIIALSYKPMLKPKNISIDIIVIEISKFGKFSILIFY